MAAFDPWTFVLPLLLINVCVLFSLFAPQVTLCIEPMHTSLAQGVISSLNMRTKYLSDKCKISRFRARLSKFLHPLLSSCFTRLLSYSAVKFVHSR